MTTGEGIESKRERFAKAIYGAVIGIAKEKAAENIIPNEKIRDAFDEVIEITRQDDRDRTLRTH